MPAYNLNSHARAQPEITAPSACMDIVCTLKDSQWGDGVLGFALIVN